MEGGREAGRRCTEKQLCVGRELRQERRDSLFNTTVYSRSVVNKSPDTEKANARAKAHEVSETFTVCTYGLLTDMCVTSQS